MHYGDAAWLAAAMTATAVMTAAAVAMFVMM